MYVLQSHYEKYLFMEHHQRRLKCSDGQPTKRK